MAGTLGGGGGGRRQPIVGINVTPMVDVVLVLLVIMMVSATYIVSKSLKVELPKAASGAEGVPMLATVLVTKEGEFLFNQEKVDEAGLNAKLKAALADNPDVNLVVSADKAAMHGQVVHVIDVARLNGILKFAINVEEVAK